VCYWFPVPDRLIPIKGTAAVLLPGTHSLYYCRSRFGNVASVQWLINGTLFEDLNLTNVGTEFVDVFHRGSLFFVNLSVNPYNNTIIQCRATYNNGEIVYSNNSTLLVQGERNDLCLSIYNLTGGLIIGCVCYYNR